MKHLLPPELEDRLIWKKPNSHDPETGQFPYVESIKHYPQPCEDCDATVVDRKLWHRYTQNPIPHCKTQCLACKLYKNPETGKYDQDNKTVRKYWEDRARDK
jgi:hypothetical protein